MEKSKFKFAVRSDTKPRYAAKTNIKRKAAFALAALFLAALLWCVFMLLTAQRQYSESGDYYSKIRAEVSADITDENNRKITFTEQQLAAVGKDIVGWITFSDTQIDYPVAQTDNNSYYCYHLPDGSYNVCGTIFMDCTKDSQMNSRNTILYGHHMKNGSMFQNITFYKDSEYYKSHKTATYYTPSGDYEIQIAYGFIISSSEWKNEQFAKDENTPQLLGYAKANTTFDSGVNITAEDKIMTFSTCSYEFNNANYMLIGKVIPKYE